MDIIILGSTGTIGKEYSKSNRFLGIKYKILDLLLNQSLKLLAKQICKYKPSYAVVEKKSDIQKLNLFVEIIQKS
ncbi:MAG: hypothetical protein CM15mP63_0910 [Gammaproteobacteria bacterium]|nr:MAG: hypothetical protein CM15mP63_0910 [Gammaproteobacteria bacterium]